MLPLGPADVAGGISVGQYVTAVDGTPLDRATNLDALLAARVGRRTVIRVASAPGDADAKDVAVLPASTGTEIGLNYRQWVEERRAYVLKASGGRLGYVHIRDMSAESLTQLYMDLDSENQARDGVVIDIRNNNGGFVNAYALDVFTRRPYLAMTFRGSAITAPARSVLGQRSLERPTVLVTNHASLSDAEDFTEGYRALEVGKVVGEPTAGWIIYTTNTALTDGSMLRLPFIRITTSGGPGHGAAPAAGGRARRSRARRGHRGQGRAARSRRRGASCRHRRRASANRRAMSGLGVARIRKADFPNARRLVLTVCARAVQCSVNTKHAAETGTTPRSPDAVESSQAVSAR